MPIHKKNCIVCNKEFETTQRNQTSCSKECSKEREHRRYQESIVPRKDFPKSKVGDISELEVAAHYLKEGYEVFRNVSANGPADIVIWNVKENVVHLVDSKTYHGKPENVHNFIKTNKKDNEVKIVPYNPSAQIIYDEITT